MPGTIGTVRPDARAGPADDVLLLLDLFVPFLKHCPLLCNVFIFLLYILCIIALVCRGNTPFCLDNLVADLHPDWAN